MKRAAATARARSGFRARGQNFLRDPAALGKVIEAIAPSPEDDFLEIGAGRGELSLPLSARSRRVLALEPDPRLFAELSARQAGGGLEAIAADFLELNLPGLLRERNLTRVRAVGNLPYSVSSPILQKLLAERRWLIDLTLMFQREVAARLLARPGTKAYGYLSIVTQQAARARVLLTLPPEAFRPRPRVHSSLVRLDLLRQAEPDVGDPELFRLLVKRLLSHRRKTISNNLKQWGEGSPPADRVRAALGRLDIPLTRRGETLSVAEFAALSRFCASPF
jgi:16S rRNA (adenine1518-N6/adenine1519-N6)-dimethyltransferase